MSSVCVYIIIYCMQDCSVPCDGGRWVGQRDYTVMTLSMVSFFFGMNVATELLPAILSHERAPQIHTGVFVPGFYRDRHMRHHMPLTLYRADLIEFIEIKLDEQKEATTINNYPTNGSNDDSDSTDDGLVIEEMVVDVTNQ